MRIVLKHYNAKDELVNVSHRKIQYEMELPATITLDVNAKTIFMTSPNSKQEYKDIKFVVDQSYESLTWTLEERFKGNSFVVSPDFALNEIVKVHVHEFNYYMANLGYDVK